MLKKIKFLIIISLTIFSQQIYGQCTGYSIGGPSNVCPNTTASYFVSGASNCSIGFVSGSQNSKNGNQISWGAQSGTYSIDFNCDCGIISKQVVVSGASAGSIQDKTITAGSTTSLTAFGVCGSVQRWEKKEPSQSWINAPVFDTFSDLFKKSLFKIDEAIFLLLTGCPRDFFRLALGDVCSQEA